MAKTKHSTQKETENIKDQQARMILKNAQLIDSAINMAIIMNRMAGMGPSGIMSSMVFVVGDFIAKMASVVEIPRKELMKHFLDEVREYVADDSNFEQETGN